MTSTLRVRLNDGLDRSYEIEFGKGLRDIAADLAHRFASRSMFVVTDSNVNRHYGSIFRRRSVRPDGGFQVVVMPAGERHKTRETKARLEDILIAHKADRRSIIIALGGGVVGDVAGFVAATLFRGLPCIQIPTSLLAQVDSSIGGKVAVDHPLGKNLIGAFHQPERVYVDTDLLATLPEKEFTNGMAEVIKMAAILDADLFEKLERERDRIAGRDSAVLLAIVKRCCELKRRVVELDERESDFRRILNFGHTIGHSLEMLSGYRLSHGRAVSIGMVAEGKLARDLGMLRESELQRLIELLRRYGLPVDVPSNLAANGIIEETSRDKKAVDGVARYTLIERIGKGRVGVQVTRTLARKVLAE